MSNPYTAVCDPAGIIYYPRYFEMFDAATSHMVSSATQAWRNLNFSASTMRLVFPR